MRNSAEGRIAASQKQWLGHPRGLSTLFFTEMWERFSYYGMRGLLILFLVASVQTGGFGLTDKTAAAIYGALHRLRLPHGSAGRLGRGPDSRPAQRVFLGGCIIAAGHFSMAFPTVPTFYGGLVLIVIGTGLLKPNVSAMVGDLYPDGQLAARRRVSPSSTRASTSERLVGPLVCGYLGEKVNWHLGFSAAGIGMVLGLIQYRFGGKYLGDAGSASRGRGDARDRSHRRPAPRDRRGGRGRAWSRSPSRSRRRGCST